MSKKNLRRLSALVTAQTLYNIAKLAAMDGRTIALKREIHPVIK